MDCMEGMKQFPDKYFDLAIVDPPYGINIGDEIGGGAERNVAVRRKAKRQIQIGGATPFGSKSQWGGVSVSRPKSTRRSTTAPSRAPSISKNWSVSANIESFSAVIISSTTWGQQSA